MEGLPTELLALIFSELHLTSNGMLLEWKQIKCKRNALLALSLVCRRFNRLVQPVLYHSLLIDTSQLKPVLRSLIRNAEGLKRGKNVNMIWLTRSEPESKATAYCDRNIAEVEWEDHESIEGDADSVYALHHDGRVPDMVPDGDLLDYYLQMEIHLPAELSVDLKTGLLQGAFGAELSLLLCICTHIEHFHVESNIMVQVGGIISALIKAVFPGNYAEDLTSLPRGRQWQPCRFLKGVQNDSYFERDSVDLNHFAAFLRLPSLISLKSTRCIMGRHEHLYGVRSAVTILDLQPDLWDAGILEIILIACPALEQLKIMPEDLRADYGLMGEALRKHGTNLRLMELNPVWTPYDVGMSESGLGDLSSLTRCERLLLPVNALFGRPEFDANRGGIRTDTEVYTEPRFARDSGTISLTHLLPRSLTTLTIYEVRDAKYCDDAEIAKLAADSSFEHLTRISINGIFAPFSEVIDNWSVDSSLWGNCILTRTNSLA